MYREPSYTSCIKIKGVPILPPLITEDRRKELQLYKEQAITVEKFLFEIRSSKNQSNNVPVEGQILGEISGATNYVPYKKQVNLSANIINVSECCPITQENNGLKTSAVEFNLDKSVQLDDQATLQYPNSSFSISSEGTNWQKRPLVRSNSYVLDNPSPMLLAHIERANSEKSYNFSLDESVNHSDNNHIEEELNTTNRPKVELITTDIKVQEINITTAINDNYEDNDLLGLLDTNQNLPAPTTDELCSNSDPEEELKAILKQLPQQYSHKIITLIDKQKQEQQKRREKFESIKRHNLEQDFQNQVNTQKPLQPFVTISFDSEDSLSKNIEIIRSARNTPKKPLFYENSDLSTTCSESLEDFSVRTVKLVDIESENELPTNNLKEVKAANIIVAYARGYLIRRLMKTEKVQRLIQTIHDALICALELQSSETVEEADVELHRRLIQQVSAACYEFHDVFFTLPIGEQMDIIAIDRQKKQKALMIKGSRSNIDFHSRKRVTPRAKLSKSVIGF